MIGAGMTSQIVPFHTLLIKRLSAPTTAEVQRLLTSVGELEQNVADHATTGGFMMAQHYPKASIVRLAVGDFGLGIPATLRLSGKSYATDSAAIIDAVRPTTTSTNEAVRGFGLHFLRRDVVDVLGGTLVIASGGGRVTWARGQLTPIDSGSSQMTGTLVAAHIPTGGTP